MLSDNPMGQNEIPLFGAGILPFVEMKALRDALREQREQLVGGRDKLSAKTKAPGRNRISAGAIQKIEEGKTKEPQWSTIARLVEAMGLTLSQFSVLLESQTNTDLPPLGTSVQTETSRSGTNVEGGAGVDTSVPASRESDLPIQKVISVLGVTALNVIERAIDRGFDRVAAQQARSTARHKSHRRPVRRKAS